MSTHIHTHTHSYTCTVRICTYAVTWIYSKYKRLLAYNAIWDSHGIRDNNLKDKKKKKLIKKQINSA